MKLRSKRSFSIIMAIAVALLSFAAHADLICDFTGDRDVDGEDLAQFSVWFAEGNPAADVNDDAVVDELDLAICSDQFGGREVDNINPTVSVSNLRDQAVLKTSFIIGTASDDDQVAEVEIKLDSGSYLPAAGTANWIYQLPTGGGTWRDDSRHTIEVRARDRFGNYSDIIALSVRKGANKDVNGDGYADLAVGASNGGSFEKVYVFYGGTDGVAPVAATTITGETLCYAFGDALSLGDINGDGYADLAIGDYGYDSSHGRVWIFYGRSAGISDTDLSAGGSADTTLDGEPGTSTNFGSQMAFGDVNGDGYADLAVEAPGWYGKIHIFHGSAAGIPDIALSASQTSDTTIVGASWDDFNSVKFGDIDADGFADLAVGARGYNSYQGRVYIFYGSSPGIADTNLRQGGSPDTTIVGMAGSYGFGFRVAFGDVNGDGYADLAAAAAQSFDQGFVAIFHGRPSRLPDIDLSAAGGADTVLTGISARNNFGYAVTVGDINADGFDDIAVGARLYNLNQGRVYLFHGTSSGIPDKNLNSQAADGVLTGESGSSVFGNSLVSDDFNGDSYLDLAVGAWYYSSFRGRVYVFENAGSGIGDRDLSQGDSADVTLTGESGSQFGYAMAD